MHDLAELDLSNSLSQKLRILHGAVHARFDFIEHVSVAVYDQETDTLRTLLDSAGGDHVMVRYEARMSDVPGLQALAARGQPRIIDDLAALGGGAREHTRRLLGSGLRSSYTLPLFYERAFYGFVFFNSSQAGRFSPPVTAHLDPFARLMGLLVINELHSIRRLAAATRTIRHITSRRDCETGAHLERMSRYARLIARSLAPRHGFSDEYIENLFLFAPLHDIGKIAIPDNILLKPGPLEPDEYLLMQSHARKGLEMIDYMLREFELHTLAFINVLRNIVYCHHEWYDGSGYPNGLAGEAIPIEARIVTAADMLDALTSARPYKRAWSNAKAFAELRRQSGRKLDPECVQALLEAPIAIAELQAQFQETVYG